MLRVSTSTFGFCLGVRWESQRTRAERTRRALGTDPASTSADSVEQADPGQPQTGRIDLGGRGQVDFVRPEPGERVLAGPLDHA
jgi:hypothetical protein